MKTRKKEPVNLYFITGFLGAGKTTLLQNILEFVPAEKVGLIINEFGQLSVDGETLRTENGYDVVEINNGQVFCGCVSGDFVSSILDYLKLPIQHLIVETSGMANPYNIEDILKNVAKQATEDYVYQGMICVVDPSSILDLLETLNATREQIAKSSFIVVNKLDLVTEKEQKDVIEGIRDLNDQAQLISTSYGNIKEEDFLSFLKRKEPGSNKHVTPIEQKEARPLNYLISGQKPLIEKKLNQFLEEATKLAYRLKGYAQTERGYRRVNAVGKNYEIEDTKITGNGFHLVLISAQGDIHQLVSSLWKRHLGDVSAHIEEKGKEYWDQ